MNKTSKYKRELLCGVGYNDGKYPSKRNNKHIKEYVYWREMLRRCYSEHWQSNPINHYYKECSVSDNFKNYSYFYEWCQGQVGFGLESYQLDKDLLVKGNLIYSEDTCVFVPRQINCLLLRSNKARGEYPIGVCYHKRDKHYRACCNDGKGGRVHLKGHETVEQAFMAYKTYKEALVKEKANFYKDVIDIRVYEALMNFTVNIDA